MRKLVAMVVDQSLATFFAIKGSMLSTMRAMRSASPCPALSGRNTGFPFHCYSRAEPSSLGAEFLLHPADHAAAAVDW